MRVTTPGTRPLLRSAGVRELGDDRLIVLDGVIDCGENVLCMGLIGRLLAGMKNRAKLVKSAGDA